MNRSVILACALATFATPTRAHASLSEPDWDERITLKVTCGGQVEGRYRGLLGAIPAGDYAARYDAWRSRLGLAAAPALGDSVLVLRNSTAPIRGVCRGFVNDALLLGRADSCADLMLPLRTNDVVMRVDDSAADSSWTGVRAQWKHAPSLCVVAVQVGDTTLAVPSTTIAATVRHDEPGGHLLRVLLVGVLVYGLLFGLAAASIAAHGIPS